MCVCMYIYVYMRKYIYIYACMCMCMYLYVYMDIYSVALYSIYIVYYGLLRISPIYFRYTVVTCVVECILPR